MKVPNPTKTLIALLIATALLFVSQNTQKALAQQSVTIPLGADINSFIRSYPAGTTFILQSGTYYEQAIRPRTGDTFIGQDGTVISGGRRLTNFQQQGSYYVVDGQTQEGRRIHDRCQTGYDRCHYPEDLYLDNTPLLHVDSLSQLRPGTWYFDYTNNRIYMYDNPTNRTVETSINTHGFYPTGDNVTIQNLTVQNYANPAQTGAIQADNTNNWTIDNVTAQLNHGGGIRLGNNMTIQESRVNYNGQIGIIGIGDNVLVEGTEIAYNNFAGYSTGWEAGGTKFVRTNNLIVRNNYVHHNNGPGLWTDINNINTLYEGNLVVYNDEVGIYHEISYDAVIRNNIVMHNGLGFDEWLFGSQILISSSSNAEIYGNEVVVSPQAGNGIGIINQGRGTGAYGPWRSYNNYVHNNTITYLGSSGDSGAASDYRSNIFWANHNNRFDYNTYYVPDSSNRWAWDGRVGSFSQFQNAGQELNGRLLGSIPAGAGTVPTWDGGTGSPPLPPPTFTLQGRTPGSSSRTDPTYSCQWSEEDDRCRGGSSDADCALAGGIISSVCRDLETQEACTSYVASCITGDIVGTEEPETIELCGEGTGFSTAIGCIPLTSLQNLQEFFTTWGVGIAGGVAIITTIIAGYQMMTSQGDPKRLQGARELLIASIGGIILLIFSTLLLRVVGVDILNILPN